MTEVETGERGPADESASSEIVAVAVAGWQRQLVAIGGPNSLLWAGGSDEALRLDLTAAHPAGLARLLSSGTVRLSQLFREPAARERVLSQAQQLQQLADRLFDDYGLSCCYLASGTASWPWRGVDRTPHAPVLLRPCSLRSVAGDLQLTMSDRLEVNPVLTATLREFGVEVDEDAVLRAVSGDTDVIPRAAYGVLRQACAQVLDLHIEPHLTVGVYSDFKLPLVRDLPGQADTIGHAEIVAALAGEPEAIAAVSAVPPEYAERNPADEWLAVDLDSAQQDIVDAVLAGADLCVVGAAGTGKTHTIASLIAAMAGAGRRVLLVAQSRGSIEAVQAHLATEGLADVLLDLGSDCAPEQTLDELRQVLRSAEGVTEQVPVADLDVQALRGRVQQHWTLMHEPLTSWGVTLDEAQERLTRLSKRTPPPRSRVRLHGPQLTAIDLERRRELQEQLSTVVADGVWTTTGAVDAWYGARLVGASQADRAGDLVQRLAHDELPAQRRRWQELCTHLGLSVPSAVTAQEQLLELLRQVHQSLEIFTPQIFDAPLDDMVLATAARKDRSTGEHRIGAMERRRLERAARALLRPGPPPRDLHTALVRARTQRQDWREAAGAGARPATRAGVPELARHTEALREDLEWLGERLAETPDGGDLLQLDCDRLQERMTLLASQPERRVAATQSLQAVDRLRGFGLGPLLIDLASRRVEAREAAQELEFVWWASIVDHVVATEQTYDGSTGEQVRGVASAYVAADARHLSLSAARLRARIAVQRATAERELPEQVGALQRHAGSVGQLLPQATELLTALAPCWAMSPLAVPAHLPAGLWFDAVIIDDASSVRLADAIPALSRGSQAVVFGDPEGASPARFPLGETSPAADVLLDHAQQLFPLRTLGTHYRSLDERLFAFAGARVYGHQIGTFPAADQTGGVRLDVLSEARYEQGTSAAEVDQVVQVLREQLQTRPQESVAVISFDQGHAAQILARVRALAVEDAGLAALLPDPRFVMTADRAIGIERDAVIVAVGFGRDERGRVPARLGAVSEPGGERLVTVAMTRARRRIVVVSGLSGDDLDPSSLRSRGAMLLRDYLLYAASGGSGRRISRTAGVAPVGATPARRRRTASTGSVLDRPEPGEAVVEVSPAIADLARRLGAEGLTVHTGHGLGDPRIDLVVEDPRRRGDLLVAIESDGAVYGSLRYARDRERIRPAQLRARGWTYERVLTRDLFRDPAKEVARLIRVVQAASIRRNAMPALSPTQHHD
ncbi:AAA family ATPase [Dermatophilaceae bacterium Sec6.4]